MDTNVIDLAAFRSSQGAKSTASTPGSAEIVAFPRRRRTRAEQRYSELLEGLRAIFGNHTPVPNASREYLSRRDIFDAFPGVTLTEVRRAAQAIGFVTPNGHRNSFFRMQTVDGPAGSIKWARNKGSWSFTFKPYLPDEMWIYAHA
jgi:hypothetical protein